MRLPPSGADPVDGDLLHGGSVTWNLDLRLSDGLSEQLLQCPRVVWVVAGEQPYRLGVHKVGREPPGREVREFVGAYEQQPMQNHRLNKVGQNRPI